MGTLAEVETRVKDLDLRVRAIEQVQVDNLRFDQTILEAIRERTRVLSAKIDALRAHGDADSASARAEIATLRADMDARLAAIHTELVALHSNGALIRSDIAEIRDILKGGRGA